jgi:amino acid adenylation domain-containing protein
MATDVVFEALREPLGARAGAPPGDPGQPAASVVARIAAVARATPNAIALEADGEHLSYGALDVRANRLAHYLRSLDVGPEVPVAICLERSFERIIAKLAVFKAGGAYVPLDPTWPEARLRFVLGDAGTPVAIVGADQAAALAHRDRATVVLEQSAAAIARCPASDPGAAPAADQLAYVVYTSGSTGEPKGVEICHGNLLNLVAWHCERFGVTAADRASHLAGLGFDAAVWEVWPYLCSGAAVSLASEAVRTAPAQLRTWLLDAAITIAFVPTPLAEPLIAAEWPAEAPLRYLLTGGDTLHNHPRAGLPFALVNNYGPSECAVVATSGEVRPRAAGDGLPPIGRPIANTEIHLLDAHGRPVRDGEIGEIHVGGAGVGRGYRGRPELTAACFVPDRLGGVPGARLYRTGDLGARLPDGQIAFHGRLDAQEKIRGHRIEPDEVVRALNRHPGVAASAVIARGDTPADKQLVAYVVPDEDAAPAADELRTFLAGFLPDYMVPASFVRLAALPLTTSGKLDRQALPEPAPENALGPARYRAPETPIEESLAAIVAGLLGIERVGADDNFFLIGGHSLLGTQVVLRARQAFGVELSLRDLFEAETVANLALVVEQLLVAKLAAMSDEEAQRWAVS